jgi:DNA replication protein DnaC
MSIEQPLLHNYLKQLCLNTFIHNHERFAMEATQNQHSYSRYLLALAEQEVMQREARRRQRRVKEAKLPVVKELNDFEFAAIPSLNSQKILQLAQGDYIRQREPVILVGNPGLGKSHIATALAVAACRQDYRVRFYNVAALVNELIQAQQEQRLTRLLETSLRHDLIVLDELGFIPFSQSGAQLIFQFCSTLYERVALLVTTNLKFGDWTQVFGDERLTLALLDRLTHRAHIIEFVGESYRFRQRRQQKQEES